jgi:hypothetical protein
MGYVGEDHKPLEIIRVTMQQRSQDQARLESLLQEFTTRLYAGFQEAVKMVQEAGIRGIATPRLLKHPAGGWRQVMQLLIEDWSIIIVPLIGAAWPNLRDEAMIPGGAFKEPCARIAFFLSQHENPDQNAFYDIIILLNSSWFAWGYGWPKQQDTVEGTNFTNLSLDLLASFTKDIHMTWCPRDETLLKDSMDTKRRAYRFGLPGEE